MNITKKIEIEENKVTATVACASLGTNELSAEEEANLVKNFVKKLKYSDITFSAKMKYADGAFTMLEDSTDDAAADNVTLGVINKEIVIDETFNATVVIDSSKIKSTELGSNSIDTAELMAQAKAKLFIEKVTTKLTSMLDDIHNSANGVEGEEEETI